MEQKGEGLTKTEIINRKKVLQEEIIIINENTLEGQRRLKEIGIELNMLDKELFNLLYIDTKKGAITIP
jgi:hypothetical protein